MNFIKNFLRSHPRVSSFVGMIYKSKFYTNYKVEKIKYSLKYDAPIDPLELIRVDPLCVQKRLITSFNIYRHEGGYSPVLPGNWDLKRRKFKKTDVFYSIYEHFAEDVPWEQTKAYQRIKEDIEETDDWYKWGCESLTDFRKRCNQIDELYGRIAKEGYQKQREISSSDDPIEKSRTVRRKYPPEMYEVTVHIDRHGNFILHEGRHRLAIAHALELNEIPVRVMARHSKWQAVRDLACCSGLTTLTAKYQNHPDIADIEEKVF